MINTPNESLQYRHNQANWRKTVRQQWGKGAVIQRNHAA